MHCLRAYNWTIELFGKILIDNFLGNSMHCLRAYNWTIELFGIVLIDNFLGNSKKIPIFFVNFLSDL